ncbi:MAG: hypothetical protein Q9186_005949 [Xanthomendoza sp. 1 TL-2023]
MESRLEACSISDSPQTFTLLLNLPLELRQLIYAFYLSTITTYLTFPPRRVIPPLLLASHQLREEAMPFYHTNATFDFDSTLCFLDCMTNLNPKLLCKLRHITVVADAIRIQHGASCKRDEDDVRFHTFDAILPLFPGLRLDTLTIYEEFFIATDPVGLDEAYAFVSRYIHAQGFKRLVYVLPSDRLLDMEVSSTTTTPFGGAQQQQQQQQQQQVVVQTKRDPQPTCDCSGYAAGCIDIRVLGAMRIDFVARGDVVCL